MLVLTSNFSDNIHIFLCNDSTDVGPIASK